MRLWLDWRLLLFWVVLTVAALWIQLFWTEHDADVEAICAESVLLYLIVQSLWAIPQIRGNLRRIDARARAFVLSVFLLTCFVQLTDVKRVFFPFCAWRMYTQADEIETVRVFDCEGFTSNGDVVRIYPSQLVPPLGSLRLVTRIWDLAREFKDQGGANRQDLAALLKSLGKLQNRRQSGNPLVRVSCIERTLAIADYRGSRSRLTSNILVSVEVK